MGRRGTTLLWSSSVTGCAWPELRGSAGGANWVEAQRNRVCVYGVLVCGNLFSGTCSRYNLQGYRIKPHGQLVLVSSMHYCTSTPSLSTSWSRTTLQGALGPGIPNLQTSFPLRCLQRLSLPYLATRQCHWHDNRYTSGTSTPVLSY